MAKKKKLPEFVYVYREMERDGSSYLIAHETIEGIDRGQVVGVYKLNATRTMSVKEELV